MALKVVRHALSVGQSLGETAGAERSADRDLRPLSGAPHDPNQAVSLVESADRARDCGIPSVVFILDDPKVALAIYETLT